MTVIEFIKFIAEKNGSNIKELGVNIGRGGSTSFWRTVTSGKIQADELKKVINSTGEPFTILYKGEKIIIK
jgi:hypothetical protein